MSPLTYVHTCACQFAGIIFTKENLTTELNNDLETVKRKSTPNNLINPEVVIVCKSGFPKGGSDSIMTTVCPIYWICPNVRDEFKIVSKKRPRRLTKEIKLSIMIDKRRKITWIL